jgi:hypothetical protein
MSKPACIDCSGQPPKEYSYRLYYTKISDPKNTENSWKGWLCFEHLRTRINKGHEYKITRVLGGKHG